MNEVLHFCKTATVSGNRIYIQCEMVPSSRVVEKKARAIFDKSLYNILFSKKRYCFVFHEPGMLPLLIFWKLVYSFLGNNKSLFVYDAHDLVELHPRKGLKHFILVFLNKALLAFAVKLNGVRFLTVSEGLKRMFEEDYSVGFYISYSVPLEFDVPKRFNNSDSKRLVYFGQINEDRISIDDIYFLSERGFSVDLYGYLIGSSESWFKNLLEAIKVSGGEFKGRYRPGDLSFLKKYDYSLMLFKPSLNIKFCMPNKLFQSLSQGVPVIVNDSLQEAVDTFHETGALVNIKFLGSGGEIDYNLLRCKVDEIKCLSKSQYLTALGFRGLV